MPEPYEIAELVAKKTDAKIGPTGAEAAHRLGLSTQMPTQPVYVTTGRSALLRIGENIIRLRHLAPHKMQYAGTQVGDAIAALRYLGKEQVTTRVIATLERTLTSEDSCSAVLWKPGLLFFLPSPPDGFFNPVNLLVGYLRKGSPFLLGKFALVLQDQSYQ